MSMQATDLRLDAASTRARPGGFYTFMAGLMIVLLFYAFTERYLVRSLTDQPAMPLFVHVHVVLFITWLFLFAVQSMLINRGAVRLHRRFGIAGILLAIAITISGLYSVVQGCIRGHNPGGAINALAFMTTGVGDILLYAGFFVAALYFRKQRELHKRLMMWATIGGFLFPIVVRVPFALGNFPIVLTVFVSVLLIPVASDIVARRRPHPLDIFSAIGIFLSLPIRGFIGSTDVWQRFAAWLTS